MPVVRFSVTDEELKELERKAKEEGTTVKLYSKNKSLGVESSIFTPKEALRRALIKYTKDDEPFCLPSLYTDEEWLEMSKSIGTAGQFGKAFFVYVKDVDPGKVEYVDGGSRGKRARYKVL
ncbi:MULTISPECIES: DUF1413 domain-containing protein [unclassified Butyrivibrio]|uniref:DUF1413 domain-containing protein n=1 Tax=unclassified Butyrivibrio TaxID=2639466 RepID=UPI00040E7174|nr:MULTISPECIES: DUF1413 domain-containing protein [unclassified Butyrivibrio]